MSNPRLMPDSQGEVFHDEDEPLTGAEVEFLEFYESMSEENQAALTRIAQLLDAQPQDEPTTKEKFEQLFLIAKNPQ